MGDSESEDSDAEGGLGNVSRVVMRPPGHSGKAKKGHLCFDASFETGNLGKVDLVSDFEYDLFIRPDTCNPYHRMWFNFIVDNIKLDQRVMFNVVNISKHKNLFCNGMTPIVKSTSRKKWYRMPPHQVYFYKSPYHNDNYILTLAFCFDKEEEAYQFSFSYPYSYTKCQAYLELIERKTLPHFKRELLGNSLQKRRIDLVTITHPSNMELKSKIRMVVICSRVHPGDSPSSYVCQGINNFSIEYRYFVVLDHSHDMYNYKGIIDFLISNNPIAEKLRNHVVFKIIPMINPDGVVLGNFRSNLLGADFNRTWNRISQWMHPPLYAINNAINKLNAHKNVELDFVIDIHAHCSLCGVFVQGNTYEDVYRHERHTLFPKLLAQNIDGYEPTYCMFNRDPKQKGSCRRFFSNLKETVNCYSIFTSFHGYTRKSNKSFIHYDEELYHIVGRNIVRSFSDYYRYVGVLPSKPKPSLKPSTTSANERAKKRSRKSRPRRHRSKVGSRVHSKIKKRKFKKFRRKYRSNYGAKKIKEALRVITSVELRSKLDLKKGFVDFSNIQFPTPTTSTNTDTQPKAIAIKRKFLSRFRNIKLADERGESSSSTTFGEKNHEVPKIDTSINIITIGKRI